MIHYEFCKNCDHYHITSLDDASTIIRHVESVKKIVKISDFTVQNTPSHYQQKTLKKDPNTTNQLYIKDTRKFPIEKLHKLTQKQTLKNINTQPNKQDKNISSTLPTIGAIHTCSDEHYSNWHKNKKDCHLNDNRCFSMMCGSLDPLIINDNQSTSPHFRRGIFK